MIKNGCLFCELQIDDASRIVAENDLAFVIFDGFPVTDGHTLIIPKRHVIDYFELHDDEIRAINELIGKRRTHLQINDATINGFNIGVNCGESAGQTIFHCHLHLIPRRTGDVQNPKGGVRHVIPEKGLY